jgi:hypothetical protein
MTKVESKKKVVDKKEDEAKKRKHRKLVVEEIVNTERTYLSQLETFVEVRFIISIKVYIS